MTEEQVDTTASSADVSLYDEIEEEELSSSEWTLDSVVWDEVSQELAIPRRRKKRVEGIERLRNMSWEPEPEPKPTSEWEAYLQFCSVLGITPMTMIQRNLQSEKLDLRCVPLGDKGIQALCSLLTSNTHVKCLDLSSSSLQEKGLDHLAEMLFANAAIEHIDLSFNHLDALGSDSIVNTIRNSKSVLKILNLSGNRLQDSQGVDIFNAILKSKAAIKNLDLSNNMLGKNATLALSRLLRDNEDLERLDLTCNCIGGPSSNALFNALVVNATLTVLILNQNNCSDDQSTGLANALTENHSLKELHLQMNRLRTAAVEGVASGMAENETLQHLDLSFNYFDEPEVLVLLEAVGRPESQLRHLDIRGMVNVTHALRHAVAKMKNIRILYGSLTHYEILKERFCLTTRGEEDCALLRILRRAEESEVNVADFLRSRHVFTYRPFEFVSLLMGLDIGIKEIDAREVAKEEVLMSGGVVDVNNLLKGIHILEYRYFS